jgi:hypothetical protein
VLYRSSRPFRSVQISSTQLHRVERQGYRYHQRVWWEVVVVAVVVVAVVVVVVVF